MNGRETPFIPVEMFLGPSKWKIRTGMNNISANGTDHVVPEFFYRGPMRWHAVLQFGNIDKETSTRPLDSRLKNAGMTEKTGTWEVYSRFQVSLETVLTRMIHKIFF
jgi:hypothetical protein